MPRNSLQNLESDFQSAWNSNQKTSVLNEQNNFTEKTSRETLPENSEQEMKRKNSRRSGKKSSESQTTTTNSCAPSYTNLSLKNLTKQDKAMHRVTLDLEPDMYEELDGLAKDANQTKAKFLRNVLSIAFKVIREQS